MKRMAVIIVTLVISVLVTATAVGVVANRADAPHRRQGTEMMPPGPGTSAPGWSDSWGPMGPARGPTSIAGESEYLNEMVAHHREAVMAAAELTRSDRPDMVAFGESIVETQTAQIDQMSSWLSDWYPETSPTTDYQPMMRDLSGLSGDDLDRAFLEDMIGHHMVAVMMSQHLLVQGTDHPEVAQLAQAIRDEQRTEIFQMRGWLAQWFDSDLRHGPGWGMGSGMGWDANRGWGMNQGMNPGGEWGPGNCLGATG